MSKIYMLKQDFSCTLFKRTNLTYLKRQLNTSSVNFGLFKKKKADAILMKTPEELVKDKFEEEAAKEQSFNSQEAQDPKTEEIRDAVGSPAKLLLSTRDTVEGRVIVEELGVVVGSSAQSRNILLDIIARVRGIFGGELYGYKEMFSNACAESTWVALKEAKELGATSLIRVKYEISSTENKFTGVSCFVICYGTAVKCIVKEPKNIEKKI